MAIFLQQMQHAFNLKIHQEILQQNSMLKNQLETTSTEILKVQKENAVLQEQLGELQASYSRLKQYANAVEQEKLCLNSRIESLQKDKETHIAAVIDALRAKILKEEQIRMQLENELAVTSEQKQSLYYENAQLKNMASRFQYISEQNENLMWDNQQLKEALEKSNRLVEPEYLMDQIFQQNNIALPTAAVHPCTKYTYFNDSASNEKEKNIYLPHEYLPTLSQEDSYMFSKSLSQEHSFYASPFGPSSQEHSSAALGISPAISRPMSQEYFRVPRSDYHMRFTGRSRSQEDSCPTFLSQTTHEHPSFYQRSSSLGQIQTKNLQANVEMMIVITADGMSNILCKSINTLDELHTGERVVVRRSSGNECGTVRALYVKIDKKPCYVGVELDLPSLWFTIY